MTIRKNARLQCLGVAYCRRASVLAGILTTGRAPVFAQTAPKKLVFAHINAASRSWPPSRPSIGWRKELTARAQGRTRRAVLRHVRLSRRSWRS